jgi:hypothetical protein
LVLIQERNVTISQEKRAKTSQDKGETRYLPTFIPGKETNKNYMRLLGVFLLCLAGSIVLLIGLKSYWQYVEYYS